MWLWVKTYVTHSICGRTCELVAGKTLIHIKTYHTLALYGWIVIKHSQIYVFVYSRTEPLNTTDRLSLSSTSELVSVQSDSGRADPRTVIRWPGAEVAQWLCLLLTDCTFMSDLWCLLAADRLSQLLERFGLSTLCLSQSGTLSLDTLAAISLTLGVQHASDSAYVLPSVCLSSVSYQPFLSYALVHFQNTVWLACLSAFYIVNCHASVLWYCWLGGRKSIRPVKIWVTWCWHGYLPGARCRWFPYGSGDGNDISWYHCHHLLLHWNPEWFCLSGAGLPRLSWKRGC